MQDYEQITFFLKTSLNCQYYLLLSPFRLKLVHRDETKGSKIQKYQAESWLPQKCLCFLLTCTGFPWILYTLLSSIPSNHKNPAAYISMSFYIIIAIYQLGFLKKYWLHQKRILKLLNFMLDTGNNIPIPDKRNFVMTARARKTMILVCFLYYCLGILYWTLRKSDLAFPSDFLENGGRLPFSWKWLWATGVLVGRDIYFSGITTKNNTEIVEWIISSQTNYPFTTLDTVVGIAASIGQYFRLMLVSQCELQFVIAVGTLWVVAKQFGTKIERYCRLSGKQNLNNGYAYVKGNDMFNFKLTWKEVQSQFEGTSELARIINQVFGWNMGIYMANCISGYSIIVNEIFNPDYFPDLWHVVGVLGYYAGICTTTLMCGDICCQVYVFKRLYF